MTCSVDLNTVSADHHAPSATYSLLLSIGSPTTDCSFKCFALSNAPAPAQNITATSNGGYTHISQKTYYYFTFPGMALGTPYTFTCTNTNVTAAAPTSRRLLSNAQGKQTPPPPPPATLTQNFTFPLHNNGSVTILNFGDWSDSQNATSNANYTTTASANSLGATTLNWLTQNRRNYYDAFLFAGDMSYNLYQMEYFNSSGQQEYSDSGAWGNRWMLMANTFLNYQPLYFSPGNHENMETGMSNLLRFFMPNFAVSKNQYYSVDIGPVHAISINSNLFSNFSSQNANATLANLTINWLVADLKNSTAKWNVIFFHQPFYCSPASSSHCGGTSFYTQNILEQYIVGKVDLVLTGHVHNYERFAPMYNGAPYYTNGTNNNQTFTNSMYPVYIACGTPGNNEGVGSQSQMKPLVAGSLASFGNEKGAAICEFTANSTSLVYTAIQTSGANAGTQLDQVTLLKQ